MRGFRCPSVVLTQDGNSHQTLPRPTHSIVKHHYHLAEYKFPLGGSRTAVCTTSRFINANTFEAIEANASKMAGRKAIVFSISYLGEMTREEWESQSTFVPLG
jgi:hypothetical protein